MHHDGLLCVVFFSLANCPVHFKMPNMLNSAFQKNMPVKTLLSQFGTVFGIILPI